jgi:hypothetical protein
MSSEVNPVTQLLGPDPAALAGSLRAALDQTNSAVQAPAVALGR